MSDEMSAEPVAWMQKDQPEFYAKDYKDERAGYVIPLYAHSPAQARAMAIAECARVVGGYANEYAGERAAIPLRDATNELRALSSPPSLSEEWVEQRLKEAYSMPGPTPHAAVRATLAALGVTVEGAAK